MKHFVNYLLFFVLLVTACDIDEPFRPMDKGFGYFPLQKGLYAIYSVNEIRYSSLAEPETLAYELLAEVVDSFKNSSGDYTHVIYRSTRVDNTEMWTVLDTWSVRKGDMETVVNESNVPYVRLTFPLQKGVVWDGNKKNTLEADDYEIKSYDESIVVNGTTFEKTLTVEQEAYDDGITKTDLRSEIYARDIGLIAKYLTQIIYCTEQVCLNDMIIETGIIYKQEIKEYGIR